MDKEQAKKEYDKIMNEVMEKHKEIEEEAKKNGTWSEWGLDSNNHLFKKVDNEAKERIKALASMIDKE